MIHWNKRNPEKCREASARYRAKHREEEKQRSRDWEKKNPEYKKQYRATPKGKSVVALSNWRRRGVECDEEWSEVYDWYMETTNCNICDKELKDSYDKCLDHDHTLEGYNVRAIICRSCNSQEQHGFKFKE